MGETKPENVLKPYIEHYGLVQRVVSLPSVYSQMRIDTPWDYLVHPPVPMEKQTFKRLGCGNNGLTVTTNGDCFSCGQLSTFQKFSLGNIRHEDILTIWRKSRSSCELFNASLAERCKRCPYLYGSECFVGCAATAMVVRGALDAGDPYCFVDLLSQEEVV